MTVSCRSNNSPLLSKVLTYSPRSWGRNRVKADNIDSAVVGLEKLVIQGALDDLHGFVSILTFTKKISLRFTFLPKTVLPQFMIVSRVILFGFFLLSGNIPII